MSAPAEPDFRRSWFPSRSTRGWVLEKLIGPGRGHRTVFQSSGGFVVYFASRADARAKAQELNHG
ncbi:MAG TPA: hypothetical protein VFA22_10485 [Stellaceae bacterium]|nr:hypothetical protein [Stellaceae bacterium]